jgi:hypothetical protein
LPELAETLSNSISTDSANMENKALELFSDIGYMSNDGDLFLPVDTR